MIHASCVSLDGRAVLLTGPSGSGKSSLALQLLAMGADLVSDDQCLLSVEAEGVFARAPDPLSGLIEARGVGLLGVQPCPAGRISALVRLDQPEPARLPPLRTCTVLGHSLRLFHNPGTVAFPAAIFQYLKTGMVRGA